MEPAQTERLVKWIAAHGGAATVSSVKWGCFAWLPMNNVEAVLNELVSAGRGVWESSPTGKRGRPARKFVLTVDYVPARPFPWGAP